jgi:hypothetical protein
MGGGYEILENGVGRYHHVGLIVPLLAAISPVILSRMAIESLPPGVNAVLAGIMVFLATYAMFKFVPFLKEDVMPLSKSILLGLIVAELMVFHGPKHPARIPSIPIITFFLFMYFFGLGDLPAGSINNNNS